MRPFLRWIYKRYPHVFSDFLVEDMIGEMPLDIKEPAVTFLAKGKQQLTKFLLFQAYYLQRRSVSDVGNAERYHGMLIMTKYLLALVADVVPREGAPLPTVEAEEDKVSPLSPNEFINGFKSYKSTRADQG